MELVIVKTNEINLEPRNLEEELTQNVRMILETAQKTVPLDRTFGIDSKYVDAPTTLLQAQLTAEIARAVSECEPRCKVKKIKYSNDGDGMIKITVDVAS